MAKNDFSPAKANNNIGIGVLLNLKTTNTERNITMLSKQTIRRSLFVLATRCFWEAIRARTISASQSGSDELIDIPFHDISAPDSQFCSQEQQQAIQRAFEKQKKQRQKAAKDAVEAQVKRERELQLQAAEKKRKDKEKEKEKEERKDRKRSRTPTLPKNVESENAKPKRVKVRCICLYHWSSVRSYTKGFLVITAKKTTLLAFGGRALCVLILICAHRARRK
jgi:hypothetical protein